MISLMIIYDKKKIKNLPLQLSTVFDPLSCVVVLPGQR